MIRKLKRLPFLALLLGAALILGSVGPAPAVAAADPATASTAPFNYFQQVYPALKDAAPVLQTATYEDIVHLFESEGNYAVLIGGAWDANTQASIGYLNQVAKELGVAAVYNFDTRLDGATLDITDSANPFAFKYVDLINKYLTNLAAAGQIDAGQTVSYVNEQGTAVSAPKITAPFLFVYNKDHKDAAGNSAPIVAALKAPADAYAFQANGGALDTAKIEAYKTLVRQTLSSAPTLARINSSAAIKAAFNKNYEAENPDKPTIFTAADGDLVYERITYHQLQRLLASEGDYALLFGGSWCPNTQAVIKYINQYAKTAGIDKVYFFDTKLDSGVTVAEPANNPDKLPHNTETLQIRDSKNPYAKLYVDLVNTYLTNIVTQNNSAEKPTVISYTDAAGQTVNGDRLQVPYFFTYNKDNKDATGAAAPILGHIELMYSWQNIQPDYAETKQPGYAVGARNSNIVKALTEVLSRVESLPSGLKGAAPTAAGADDGRITGTAGKALEYKRLNDATYTPVTGDAVTGLAAGVYQVRYAAINGYQGPTTATGATAVAYPAGASVFVVVPQPARQPAAPVTFADVPDKAWYREAVSYLSGYGVTSGVTATHFGPHTAVTRGQFIALLFKGLGISGEVAPGDNFSDAGNTYYTGALGLAKQLGITSGSGNNRFNPDAPITRQDLFTLLHRTLEVTGRLPSGQTGAALVDFKDAAELAAYARPAWEDLVKSGIVSGSGGYLKPQSIATRAEAAQILYNLLIQTQ